MKRYIILAALCFAIGGCYVTRQQVESYDKRLAQAEQVVANLRDALPKAIAAADKAEELAQRIGSEQAVAAAQIAATQVRNLEAGLDAAQTALTALHSDRPVEGEPWWITLIGLATTVAGTFMGYRKGLVTPVPQKGV